MFSGVFTAIITPLKKGKIDERSLRDLVEWQIQEGIHGVVSCGSTGEMVTLSEDEWKEVVGITVDQAANRVPIFAGAGSNSTNKAINFTKMAKRLGVTATLQVTPYYNKPTQGGLYQHFKTIADAVPDLPVVLYNVPSRTAVNILPETVARLSKIKNIVGIKESSGDLNQMKKIVGMVANDFCILCGEDAQNLAAYEIGAVGAVSVTSNIVPSKVSSVFDKYSARDREGAKMAQEELQPLNKIIFIETNPIPIKTALSLMGRCQEEFRLPMTQMSKENKEKLKEVLKNYKLIS